jgi:hypothetical protein
MNGHEGVHAFKKNWKKISNQYTRNGENKPAVKLIGTETSKGIALHQTA